MQESPLPQPDFILAARWIVPVEPPGLVLDDHAVVIGDGRILAIQPAAQARLNHPETPVIERPGHVLMPGLVNAHTHLAMTLFRGLGSDQPLDQWLGEHVWPAEQRWVSPEFVRDGTRLAILEMVRGGTTCCSDMYYFPDVAAGLAVEHRFRMAVGMIVMDRPTAWAADSDEYIAKGLALHDQYRGHPLVHATFAPHAPYSVTDGSLARVRLLADELGVPVHMHLHETGAEIHDSLRDHGQRPLARLQRLGLVSPQLIAVHMTHLLPEEIELAATSGLSVVHCAESNLKLASGLCQVQRLAAAGVPVALGTDGAASNNDLDMLGEMRTAALLAKGVSGDPRAFPAAAAITAATLGGARALGLADDIGSLVPGKMADMICIDLSDPATQPVHDILAQIVYAASRSQVTDSWIAGEQVMDEGRVTCMPVDDTLARAAAWRERLAETVR
jgi:5-methylthioadenosine/S-adenosylhomocysteine deaminase